MKKLYLIRHGETDWNAQKRFQGRTDTPLSTVGRQEAERLAEKMAGVKCDIIFCSPLQRAYDTALPLARLKNMDVVTNDALCEISFGRWEGLTYGEISKLYADEFKKSRRDPATHGFHKDLTFAEVKNTVGAFLDEFVYNSKHRNIFIVSHSVILKMVLLQVLKLPPSYFHSFHLTNVSVSKILLGTEFGEMKGTLVL